MSVSRNASVALAVSTYLARFEIVKRSTITYTNINCNVLIPPCILSIAIFCLNILHMFDIFSTFLHLHVQNLHVSNCPLNLSKSIIIHNNKILNLSLNKLNWVHFTVEKGQKEDLEDPCP
jgi:hypothetical protein